jgi:hypothetical protein
MNPPRPGDECAAVRRERQPRGVTINGVRRRIEEGRFGRFIDCPSIESLDVSPEPGELTRP